jgi:hypothetical protein
VPVGGFIREVGVDGPGEVEIDPVGWPVSLDVDLYVEGFEDVGA